MRTYKKILFGVIMVLMFAPLLQYLFPFFDMMPLTGISGESPKPHYSRAGFIETTYQDSLHKYLDEHIGFRPALIRTLNQLDYTLFKESKSPGVIVGKDGQFFIESYIENYTGRYFKGNEKVKEDVRRIKVVQDSLKKKFNTDLIIVFAPGKASFYPEFIPDRFMSIKYPTSHYTFYKDEFARKNVNFLDLNHYFKKIKSKSPYLLYPKYGTHWSSYGVFLGADTIVKYIEHMRKTDLPDVNINRITFSDSMRNTDFEIGILLNIHQQFKPDPMPYVEYGYTTDSSKQKPDVLAVGDSYWWSIVQAGIPANVFKEDVYWIYGNAVYINNVKQEKYVKDLDLKAEVEKRDVIVVMSTEATLGLFPFDFIDKIYLAYAATKEEKVEYWIKTIKATPEWMENIKKGAEKTGKDLETHVKENALWWVEQGH